MQVEHTVLELDTRHAFHIARAGAPVVHRNVWVKLISATGEGWGEAAPNAYYAENAGTVANALARVAARLGELTIEDSDSIAAAEAALLQMIPAAASARAALSAAMFDLLGKRLGVSTRRLLHQEPQRAQYSSFTIGIDEIDIMREKTREARAYRILKVKIGTSNDEAILDMLREERPDAVIRVDANTAWSVAEAVAKLPMLEAYDVELVEQPLPAADYEGLARVRAASRIPIIADESCKVAADVERVAGCVDGVNIKLAKCGSLFEAVRLARAARARNLSVMLGCMIESTLGIATAMQLAPLADYVDLDGAALLADDPFAGPHLEPDGLLRLTDAPGLGVVKR